MDRNVKNYVLKTIFPVVKHVKFQLYMDYPVRMIWVNQQLTKNMHTNKSNFLYIKQHVPQNERVKKKTISAVRF